VAPRTPSDPAAVAEALAAVDAGDRPGRDVLGRATRHLLAVLAARHPGRAVEVRIPPYGAVQCGEGPRHTRGTPPNVVEADPLTWLLLGTGRLPFATAVAEGRATASGARADLTGWLPLT